MALFSGSILWVSRELKIFQNFALYVAKYAVSQPLSRTDLKEHVGISYAAMIYIPSHYQDMGIHLMGLEGSYNPGAKVWNRSEFFSLSLFQHPARRYHRIPTTLLCMEPRTTRAPFVVNGTIYLEDYRFREGYVEAF
jgi:hypothetical protein